MGPCANAPKDVTAPDHDFGRCFSWFGSPSYTILESYIPPYNLILCKCKFLWQPPEAIRFRKVRKGIVFRKPAVWGWFRPIFELGGSRSEGVYEKEVVSVSCELTQPFGLSAFGAWSTPAMRQIRSRADIASGSVTRGRSMGKDRLPAPYLEPPPKPAFH